MQPFKEQADSGQEPDRARSRSCKPEQSDSSSDVASAWWVGRTQQHCRGVGQEQPYRDVADQRDGETTPMDPSEEESTGRQPETGDHK